MFSPNSLGTFLWYSFTSRLICALATYWLDCSSGLAHIFNSGRDRTANAPLNATINSSTAVIIPTQLCNKNSFFKVIDFIPAPALTPKNSINHVIHTMQSLLQKVAILFAPNTHK